MSLIPVLISSGTSSPIRAYYFPVRAGALSRQAVNAQVVEYRTGENSIGIAWMVYGDDYTGASGVFYLEKTDPLGQRGLGMASPFTGQAVAVAGTTLVSRVVYSWPSPMPAIAPGYYRAWAILTRRDGTTWKSPPILIRFRGV